MHSHFLLLVLFAIPVSVVFALLGKDDWHAQLRLSGLLVGVFVGAAVVMGWVMYLFPL
jgi:hypothetical protein